MTARTTGMALAALVLATLLAPMASAQDQSVPRSLVRFAGDTLVKAGQDANIVALVAAQNSRGVGLDRIKQIDQEWMAEKGVNAFMRALLDSTCSARLKAIVGQYPYILEAFVMDNQGALVGLTNKTSDYWQGDEAKFTESTKGGTGAVHYGKAEFDKSINATVVQISVPVVRGGVIGAITFGVSIEAWEKR